MHFDKERGYFRTLMLPTLLKPEQLLKEQEIPPPKGPDKNNFLASCDLLMISQC